MESWLATVGTDRRIELTGPAHTEWLRPEDKYCLAEIDGRGQVFLRPLRNWAEERSLDEAAALALIQDPSTKRVMPPEIQREFMAEVSHTRRRGRTSVTLTIPDTVVFFLFPSGVGPAAPKRKRESMPVLAQRFGDGIYLWGEEGKEQLADTSLV